MSIIATEPTPIDLTLPSCSICGVSRLKVVRFGLMRPATLPDGRHTTRGAGAIHLCERCWRSAVADVRRHTGRGQLRRRAAA